MSNPRREVDFEALSSFSAFVFQQLGTGEHGTGCGAALLGQDLQLPWVRLQPVGHSRGRDLNRPWRDRERNRVAQEHLAAPKPPGSKEQEGEAETSGPS